MDSQYIIYTGIPTATIPIAKNQNLQLILQNIDAAINTHNTAPDYSGYNLYCVKQTDGITHPTNTQNFAEGISKNLCDFHTTYTTFTGTTYVSDKATFTTAIAGLQVPALTYAPFSITSSNTVTQVWNKSFTGFDNIIASILPTSANWSTLSISPNPTTIVGAFNDLIAYLSALNTTVNGKQAAIATFNNTGNCLAGGATDTIRTTVASLITYTCALPIFDYSTITTWGALTPGTNLQTTAQTLVNGVNYLYTNSVVSAGTGLTLGSVGSTYQGKKLTVDTSYTQLYKVMVTGDSYTDADVLDHKVGSADSSLTLNVTGNKLNIQVTNPLDYKVKINSSDTTADYLAFKITNGSSSDWGIGVSPTISIDSSQLQMTPSVSPATLFGNMLTYISNTPSLFTQFQQLVNQTSGGSCAVPTSLAVTNGTTQFNLAWTPSGSASSQVTKYRQKGSALWVTDVNFNPGNPRTSVATTSAAVLGFNTVYEFAVDSICADGGIGTSNVFECIIYSCQSTTHTIVGGVISITQSPLSTVDTIQYRLKNAGNTVVDSKTATGLAPQVSFASQSSGTYHAEWRYGTLVNGVTLYSDDASQVNAWCAATGLIIP